MAEEGKVLEERIENRLDRLEQGQIALREDVAELKGMRGVLEQMDRRLSNLEQGQRWVLGLVFGAWITLMMTILFKG